VLTQFEAAGLVTRHHFEDVAVFQAQSGAHHDHIIMDCGRGRVRRFGDRIAPGRIAKAHGFTISAHS
jgi:Fur family ferric uptake transcriptional regulator